MGNESDSFHVDFVSTDTLFIVGSIENPIDKKAFKELFEKVRDDITTDHVHSLSGLEKVIDKVFAQLRKESGFALAASLVVGNVLYLVTRGGGAAFIERGPVFQKLISDDLSSSGYIEEDDLIVLTNSYFTARVSAPTLQRFVQGRAPQEIIESLTPDLKSSDDSGLIALFARHHANAAVEEVADEGINTTEVQQEMPHDGVVAPVMVQESVAVKTKPSLNIRKLFGGLQSGSSLGKKLTFVLLVALIGVFIWSVILGNQRRQRNAFIKKVEAEAQTIGGQLEEASSLTASNVDRSLELLASAKNTYAALQTEAAQKKITDLEQLVELGTKLADAEKSIKKEEETETDEFYDLQLIDTSATATAMYYDGTTLALLDKKNSKVYLLNLEKKSVVTRRDAKVESASFVALHQDDPYVFSAQDGVFRITKDKAEVLVEKDEEWGGIKDMWMYNGNIYMVDAGKDEIYKYLVAEGGYSAKTSYIKSGKADLANATSMAIDKSIYVANGSRVLKYESGGSVGFSVKIPGGDGLEFDDMFTSEDIDNVYLLNKKAKKIFVVSKEGEFLKQISASAIANTTDFVVDEAEGILLLVDNKLVKIVE